MDEDEAGSAPEPGLDRLTSYTYLTVPDRLTYLAVMRIFTATLLTDLSADDVAERLSGSLSADAVAGKLETSRPGETCCPAHVR